MMQMNDEEEISRVLASITAVNAPDNFEGGVRSRIAERREDLTPSRSVLLLVAKFAFPLLLLLVVGGFLIVFSERELSADTVPPVDEGSRDVASVEDSTSVPSNGSNTRNGNSGVAQLPVNRTGANSRPASLGGSEDAALSSDDSTVFPQGVDPRKAALTNSQPPNAGQISPASILSMLGISAECNSARCVASTVQEGSLAAQTGIQSGDLITAIDGMPVNESNNRTGMLTVRDLTLIRSGKTMTISVSRR